MPDGVVPVPPDQIRPGQLGAVLLGRVIVGDIATTLVDLSLRGLLTIEQGGDASHPDWLLRPLNAGTPRRLQDSLLAYERTLLAALSDEGRAPTIRSLAPGIAAGLNKTRAAILDDAVDRGWLHRFRHDQRTDAGEQMNARIRRFQRDLRALTTDQGQDALRGRLLPFALHFGMVDRDQIPLGRFARAWVDTFGSLPGWHESAPRQLRIDEPDAVAKPTIDEQLQHLDNYLFLE